MTGHTGDIPGHGHDDQEVPKYRRNDDGGHDEAFEHQHQDVLPRRLHAHAHHPPALRERMGHRCGTPGGLQVKERLRGKDGGRGQSLHDTIVQCLLPLVSAMGPSEVARV